MQVSHLHIELLYEHLLQGLRYEFQRDVLLAQQYSFQNKCFGALRHSYCFSFEGESIMDHVSLMNFCARTGLTEEEVRNYEARGIIRNTTKGNNPFYSLREVYRAKGIIYLIRTGLSAEDAAARIDQETMAANSRKE